MTEIRAFVGHSFTDDDGDVVRKFLKYFDQLSESALNFSWQHAEAAEPKVLAQKVMALLSDMTVFIGICTKKERVISPASLSNAFFGRGVLKAQENEFSWKTSDWIIQEIGLAIGKNLDLILLVENDVRVPGGLQSNLEYIPFDRNAPERSFGKIVEMISAISPGPSSPSAASSHARSMPAAEERGRETPEDDSWKTPQPGWKRRDYELAFWRMTLSKDASGIAIIDQAYLKTEDAAQGDNRNSWEAFCESIRLKFGEGGNLENLETLAEARPDSSKTLVYLARGYELYQDYAKAASTYEAASSKATDDTEALRLKGRAAVDYVRAELRETALAIVSQMKIRVEDSGNGELQLLEVLRELAELENENEANIAIMERIVEVDPSRTDTRFSLAYKHSECENKDLALLHYLKIPRPQRKSVTWNNLGVAFDQFSLPAKSVVAYRRAEKMGGTLAMSNLALKFISAGFLPEAQKLCDEALAIEDYHKNVGQTLATLKGLPNEEENEEAELLKKAKPKSDFYKQFGRAASRPDPSKLAERWEGPDCVLDVTVRDGTFRAVGSYEQQTLSSLMIAARGSTESGDASVRYRVEYSGTLRGRAIEGRVTRTRENEKRSATILTRSTDETKVLYQ